MILLYMIFILASVGVLVRGVEQDGGDLSLRTVEMRYPSLIIIA